MAEEHILLAHGSGGVLTRRLIRDVFLEALRNPALESLRDSALLKCGGARIAFTTDSYVVKPLFFPGGDMGKLSVCGTVNDLAVMGARPLWLSASVIIEEGFPVEELKTIVRSMAKAAREAGVEIVTGDTKTVERGGADGLFITTAGVGILDDGAVSYGVEPGDVLLLSGHIGDHGIAVISRREGLRFRGEIESDCAPLGELIAGVLRAAPGGVRWLRDPTRGGVAAALNELAEEFDLGVELQEEAIPLREEVKGACEMLGFDPLYVANEGKVIAVVAEPYAEKALEAMRENRYGTDARAVGRVVEDHPGRVVLRTRIGGTRIIDMPRGEQLPRIC
jgi:hydrogenase expression/formation protein HypE